MSRSWWQRLHARWAGTTRTRVATVLGTVALVAIAVVVTAAVFTRQSTGQGAAINIAGSLRMQSYLLATRVADTSAVPEVQAVEVAREIAAFERRLNDPRLVEALPAGSALRAAHDRIAAAWPSLHPLASAAPGDEAARRAFLARVHPFVADVDAFVVALERNLEGRIRGLQIVHGVALAVIVTLVVATLAVLDAQVFVPIRELARGAQAVRAGDFAVRVADGRADELGQLGRGFNHMVTELQAMYGSLERQIAAKTADLAEKNRALTLLFDVARELSAPELDAAALDRVARGVREALEVDGVTLCVRAPDSPVGLPLATAGSDATRSEVATAAACAACFDGAGAPVADPARHPAHDGVLRVPLRDAERTVGLLRLALRPGQVLGDAQHELVDTLAHHLGRVLAAAQAREEHGRLALMEERSAIARELHDSLAQSLSYTKIQLLRLETLLPREAGAGPARTVLKELRDGVSAAYRQLRELLTTFRLQLSGAGLAAGLRQAATEFTGRSRVPVDLTDTLAGPELSAHQQIHVLQIVREALANVHHHAQATQAWVRLVAVEDAERGRMIELEVRDDGVGLPADAPERTHHFGLTIMHDRAALLGGRLEVGPAAGGGTRLHLRFPAGRAAARSDALVVAP